MKRVQIADGKFVMVSDEIVQKMARALAASPFTKERVREIIKAEPRIASTVLVGHCSQVKTAARRRFKSSR